MSKSRISCIGFGDLVYHTLSSARCARLNGRGALIVTATDGSSEPIVWVAGADSDNQLHGFRGDNGKEKYTGDEVGDASFAPLGSSISPAMERNRQRHARDIAAFLLEHDK